MERMRAGRGGARRDTPALVFVYASVCGGGSNHRVELHVLVAARNGEEWLRVKSEGEASVEIT